MISGDSATLPDEFADLTPEFLYDLEQQATRLLAQSSLADFCREAWHVVEPSTPLIWGPHLDAICEHLEAVSRGDIQNLVITIPPGSTKSITCGVMWPAWTWATNPGVRWLTASNDGDLVIRDAVAGRRLIESDWYRGFWGDSFRLTSDQNVKSWYENDKRGFRVAVSVRGGVTGKKGDILLLDDPDDARKVRSEMERKSVAEWWDQAFFNRVNHHKTGRRVVIGQRVHEKDLIGHILDTGGFEHLNIPEEFDPGRRTVTSIGWTDWRQRKGELLRPERFGPEEIEQAKKRLRSGYEAQHNQNPVPIEGSQFKREWFDSTYYFIQPGTGWYFLNEQKKYMPHQITRRFLTVDSAATVKQTAKDDPDWTVVSAWGQSPEGYLLWLGCERAQVEIPDIAPIVGRMYLRWNASIAHIEGFGIGKGPAQLCNRYEIRPGVKMNIVEFRPKGDKLQNAYDAISMAEAGRVWLPANAPDFPLADVEAELFRFSGDPKQDGHDDIIDTLSRACRVVMGKSTDGETVKMSGAVKEGLANTGRTR